MNDDAILIFNNAKKSYPILIDYDLNVSQYFLECNPAYSDVQNITTVLELLLTLINKKIIFNINLQTVFSEIKNINSDVIIKYNNKLEFHKTLFLSIPSLYNVYKTKIDNNYNFFNLIMTKTIDLVEKLALDSLESKHYIFNIFFEEFLKLNDWQNNIIILYNYYTTFEPKLIQKLNENNINFMKNFIAADLKKFTQK